MTIAIAFAIQHAPFSVVRIIRGNAVPTQPTINSNTNQNSSECTIQSASDLPVNGDHDARPGTFLCKVPGCKAPPFQTNYLLQSHTSVHSNDRPHFFPVQGCSRALGGKGFKRRNELIRHGLVHGSPGYTCPFCTEKEHKYPRPDNLQRHVRINHPGKTILFLRRRSLQSLTD
jgi:hypothetical protein